ncbi:CheR family methyltransferase [Anaerobacillus sp. MEB173]|uniref:CheR family methyltransferase n=1 Tax=Anaerobacillus sp. MEB173 TaxID=3383345 RepID=UPI003F93BA57
MDILDFAEEEYDELENIELDLLLQGIFLKYGFDFRNYARSSVKRRIWQRIHTERLKTISGLQEKVLHNPKMMDKLFHDFSINVTEMFRDPSFFKAFRTKIIPVLREYPYIRIWHAGCSSGEEVYSMAILLHEEGLYKKARIYATDMNESLLEKAKKGCFPLTKMKDYTKNYHQAGGKKAFSEYYTAQHDSVEFHPFLKENIIFAHHNLATDHSFNEFHVILCRNVMIYFDETLQHRVHQLFFDSLSLHGFLGLGSKESITYTKFADLYEEVDSVERIYRKVTKGNKDKKGIPYE